MVSYEYFLDGCCIYELNDIVDNVFYTDTNLWESARISNYVLAQINSRSPIEPKELIKFKWDEEVEVVKNTEITTEQIKSLKERAKNIKINDFL